MPGHAANESMEGTKKAEVSGWSEAYNKRLKRLLRNEVSARVNDPNTVKNLMRHTSLNTTTLYTRTVTERMKDAVKDLGKPLEASLGGKSGSNSLRKKTQNSTLVKLAIKELIARRAKGNSGGGSETV